MRGLADGEPRQVGGYRLLGRLGEGGMGDVYLARSDRGRMVAVKLVRAEVAAQEEFRARFRYEVEAARQVGGHWTAPVLEADTEAAVPWVATDYVAGPSLRQVVAHDNGPLPEYSVRTLAAGLAHALRDIHGAGIVHRDLKPSNVLVTIDGPRVIDFGIARALKTVTDGSITRTGALVGSPGFMAPEQVRGDRITPACDIFCLGLVLLFAASGKMAFGTAQTGAHVLMYRIAHEEPDLADFPAGGVDLVRDCLEKNPAARPSVDEVLRRTGAQDSVVNGRSKEPWLPGPLMAQLGRHAVDLLGTDSPDLQEPAAMRGTLPLRAPGQQAAFTAQAEPTPAIPAIVPLRRLPGREPPGASLAASGTAPSPARASSRMSRRSALTALTFAGAASGLGALFWLLPDDSSDSGGEKRSFELPIGKNKIDAVMPVPSPGDPTPSSNYWIFADDRYLMVSASDTGHPVARVLEGPSELSQWGATIGNIPGFREKVTGVMGVPGKPGQHWVFSQDQYVRIGVSPEGGYRSTLKSIAAPIEQWAEAFNGFSRIDAMMPVPDDDYQYWVFSGSDYVRTRLWAEGQPGGKVQQKGGFGSGWPELSKRFNRGIDAAMRVPNNSEEYWVFSGKQYLKLRVPVETYDEQVLLEPLDLRIEPA
ncbi:serine/threonine-protein kinase [Streptomyces sp. NPDC096080]|uniref:serine/threonine protein kinase n=1 Tax=Streptomyces sp. NPDC096080 TaxID=3156693 RepID=UPI003316E3E4